MSRTTRRRYRRGGACRERKDRTGSARPSGKLLPSWPLCEPGSSLQKATSATSRKYRDDRLHKAHGMWSWAQGETSFVRVIFPKSTESRRSSGPQIICGPAQLRHRQTNTIWNPPPIGVFLEIRAYSGSFNLSCDPVRPGGQPSCPPPANCIGLQRISFRNHVHRARPAALHHLQQLIQYFEILVLRLQLSILLQRRRSRLQVTKL